ncbi:MAG: hypothetical protein HY074_12035, partial [Deltaproteobacteria bacterium]|nr:hypothetical protein [Deltaproteobacteria bacterium]
MAKTWLQLSLFFAITAACYINAFHGAFIGDDIGRIARNEQYFQQGLFSTLADVLPDRPILSISLWVNYRLSGLNPFAFKLVNVALHALTGFYLFKTIS